MKSDVLTQEITDLSEGIEYAFRVIATNEYGRSDPLTSDPVAPKSLFGNCYSLFNFGVSQIKITHRGNILLTSSLFSIYRQTPCTKGTIYNFQHD